MKILALQVDKLLIYILISRFRRTLLLPISKVGQQIFTRFLEDNC